MTTWTWLQATSKTSNFWPERHTFGFCSMEIHQIHIWTFGSPIWTFASSNLISPDPLSVTNSFSQKKMVKSPASRIAPLIAMSLAVLLNCLTLAAAGPYAQLPAVFSPTATCQLTEGTQMPVMGLGVYMMKQGEETYNAATLAAYATERGNGAIFSDFCLNKKKQLGSRRFARGGQPE